MVVTISEQYFIHKTKMEEKVSYVTLSAEVALSRLTKLSTIRPWQARYIYEFADYLTWKLETTLSADWFNIKANDLLEDWRQENKTRYDMMIYRRIEAAIWAIGILIFTDRKITITWTQASLVENLSAQ